jgi:NADPH-dependent 2,4-dienoyl-CoA reductase/sulfur reductase-like enzyme
VKHLILGFGAAGANAAEGLRQRDPEAEITVLNGESRPFYLRLDLEGILLGKGAEQLMPRPPEYWEERGIRVVPGRALRINPSQHEVQTESAGTLSYDRLLIAVGSAPRDLPVPGRGLYGIFHYHTLDDALAIHALRERAWRAVIVGGGILGLELAHAARAFGWQVTLLVRGEYAGAPIVDASGGAFVLSALERAGVKVIFREEVAAFEGRENHVTAVRTKAEGILECDFAGICVGVAPDVGFLEGSGLLEDGQLIVNERMQTSDPEIFAAGDCALVHATDGRLIPCRNWNVASAQARVAAANMSGADSVWTEGVLYNLDYLFGQEFALIGPWADRHLPERALHEFFAPGSYRALVTRHGILESAMLLGDRSADRRVRKLIAAGALVENRLPQVLDANIPLDSLLKS